MLKRVIKDFLAQNPDASEATIKAECVAKGYSEDRAGVILALIVSRGKIIKNGDEYSLRPNTPREE